VAEALDSSEESVLAEARAATGLEDFGDESFHGGLRALLRTYAENPFSEKGRRRNRRRVVTLLSTRLKLEAALRQHPEVLARPVRSPVVLTGLPRSATSALSICSRPVLRRGRSFPGRRRSRIPPSGSRRVNPTRATLR